MVFLGACFVIHCFLRSPAIIQPAVADALTFPGRLSSARMVPLGAVTCLAEIGSWFRLLSCGAKEEEKESNGAEAGDPQSASPVADGSGAGQDEAGATWSQSEEEEKREEEVERKTRSCGVAKQPHPEPLGVFPRVKQKPADLKWWCRGVHQVVLWVGAVRPGQESRHRGQVRRCRGAR